MISDWARRWGGRVLEGIARPLWRLGLSPNAVTIIGFVLTLAVAVLIGAGWSQLGGLLLIFTLLFDAIDGTLARLSSAVSPFGGFLDSTLDRWSEISVYCALTWLFLGRGQQMGVLLAVAALAASLMVSYTRARAESAGLAVRSGLLTRLERMIVLILGLVTDQVIWALLVIAVLATFTAIQRIWVAWKLFRRTG